VTIMTRQDKEILRFIAKQNKKPLTFRDFCPMEKPVPLSGCEISKEHPFLLYLLDIHGERIFTITFPLHSIFIVQEEPKP